MSEGEVPPGDDYDPAECSHDEAYLVEKAVFISDSEYYQCRRCGQLLWFAGGHRLKVEKAPKVVNYSYECIDCGEQTELPSGVYNSECSGGD